MLECKNRPMSDAAGHHLPKFDFPNSDPDQQDRAIVSERWEGKGGKDEGRRQKWRGGSSAKAP